MPVQRVGAFKKIIWSMVLLMIMALGRLQAAGPVPVILVQPLSATVLFLGTTTLTVVASSGTTMTYQWTKNGMDIAGATSAAFGILNAQSSDQGAYTVRILNAGGAVTSSVATVSVLAPPAITADPQSAFLSAGNTLSLSVSAVGSGSLTYSWLFNGSVIPGAMSSTLTVTNVDNANAGNYAAVVSNPYGSTTSAVALVNIQSWVRTFNGSDGDDAITATTVDSQGNVYFTGYAKQNTGGPQNYLTMKCDSTGAVQWSASYDSVKSMSDEAVAIAVDAAGNVYVTGSSQLDPASGGWDYATIKYNAAGQQQWVARYSGSGGKDDYAAALAVDASGNVIVTGKSKGTSDKYQYATVKYNSSGQQVWAKLYASSAATEDDATSVAVDASGNVYVTGQSKGTASDFDYATIKYAPDGTQLWVARYNGSDNTADQPVKVAVDASGNVIVTGASRGTGSSFDFLTVKYDPAGVQQWTARYNGPANKNDKATAMALDRAGNIFVTGYSETAGGVADYTTIKYSPLGVQLWVQRYDYGADDEASSIALDPSGDVYVTGASKDGSYDVATVKYLSQDGSQLWAARYAGGSSKDDAGVMVAVDPGYNLYVGGYANKDVDFLVIKYAGGLHAPGIMDQPVSQAIVHGTSATFCVNPCGTLGFSYQWYFNGNPLAGETNAALTVPAALPAAAGSYSVTVSNQLGFVCSDSATLSFLPFHASLAPRSAGSFTQSGAFTFNISAFAGAVCVIEATDDMHTWNTLVTFPAPSANFTFTDFSASAHPRRFYRVSTR